MHIHSTTETVATTLEISKCDSVAGQRVDMDSVKECGPLVNCIHLTLHISIWIYSRELHMHSHMIKYTTLSTQNIPCSKRLSTHTRLFTEEYIVEKAIYANQALTCFIQ